MESAINISASIWENMYKQKKAILEYPDTVFVPVANRFLLKSNKQQRILDYGFGSGSNTLHLLKRGFKCCGVEVSQEAIDITQRKISQAGYSAELKLLEDGKIPFAENTFDSVIAWHVLCYNDWQTFTKVISEINRVLRPGGIFLGTMLAPGHSLLVKGRLLDDGLYESKAHGQEGALLICIKNEKQLKAKFPGQKISIGKMSFDFVNINLHYWIVSYENIKLNGKPRKK